MKEVVERIVDLQTNVNHAHNVIANDKVIKKQEKMFKTMVKTMWRSFV